jgi:hypothetical protein
MNLGGIAAGWGQMSRPQQVASGVMTTSALLLAIGAVGLALRSQAVWGKVLIGAGAIGLGLGLALCCWRPAQAAVPAVQVAQPAQPQALVVGRLDAFEHANRWMAQLQEHGPAAADRLEQELAELVAECQGYRDRHDGALGLFSSRAGVALGRRYLQVYPAEQARWHFLRHVAASPSLRAQLVIGQAGFPWSIWNELRRSPDRGLTLQETQSLFRSENWLQNSQFLALRPQLAAHELMMQLGVWFFDQGDRPSQCDTALGLRDLMRLAAPVLWPEGAVALELQEHPLNVHLFRFAEGVRIREQNDARRERIILHIADSLATLIRVVQEDGTLARGAVMLGELSQRLVDRWRERGEAAVAQIEQGETGLLEQIAAVRQAP